MFEGSVYKSPEVVAGLISAAAGLLGVACTIAAPWLNERRAAFRRMSILEEATKRITFWQSWFKIAIETPGFDPAVGRSKLRAEVMAAAAEVEAGFREVDSENTLSRYSSRLIAIRSLPIYRRLLLLYRPPRALSWIPRFFLYGSAIQLVLVPVLFPEVQYWPYVAMSALFWTVVFYVLAFWSEWRSSPRGLGQREHGGS